MKQSRLTTGKMLNEKTDTATKAVTCRHSYKKVF